MTISHSKSFLDVLDYTPRRVLSISAFLPQDTQQHTPFVCISSALLFFSRIMTSFIHLPTHHASVQGAIADVYVAHTYAFFPASLPLFPEPLG